MPIDVPCKYFLRGRCTKGDNCPFYHGPDATIEEPEACKFFLRGFCAAGESCRFQHGTITTPVHHPRPREVSRFAQPSEQWSGSPSPASPPFRGHEEGTSYGSCGASRSDTAAQYDRQGRDFHVNGTAHGEGNVVEGYGDDEDYDGGGYGEEWYGWTGEFGKAGGGWIGNFELAEEAEDGTYYEDHGEFNREAWEEWATTQDRDWAHIAVCPQYMQSGFCRSWQSCERPHGHLCSTCQKWVLHPYNEAQRIAHTEMCVARSVREASRTITSEQECSICLENVMGKEAPSERRFGLLSCDHPFCLACVRGWRSHIDGGADVDSALRTCPVCREPCHFVTPSKVWPRDQQERAAIVEAYKKKLGSIDCKYWLARPEGDRTCPFGTSCFYRHTGAEAAPRKYLTADGEIRLGGPVMLSQFLGDMRL